MTDGKGPFSCEACSESDKGMRNCFNVRGLSERARALSKYDEDVVSEHKKNTAKKVFTLGDIRLYECPLSYITSDTRGILRVLYMADFLGTLVLAGGIAEQPCWFIEAVEIYGVESAKALKEK